MDAVLTAVLGSAPELGVAGGAVWFIVLLLRREASTEERHGAELKRKDEMHAAELKRKDEMHEAELDRINRAHDDELAELRDDVKGLRERLDELQAAFDLEREVRRKAEDELAALLRQRGGGT